MKKTASTKKKRANPRTAATQPPPRFQAWIDELRQLRRNSDDKWFFLMQRLAEFEADETSWKWASRGLDRIIEDDVGVPSREYRAYSLAVHRLGSHGAAVKLGRRAILSLEQVKVENGIGTDLYRGVLKSVAEYTSERGHPPLAHLTGHYVRKESERLGIQSIETPVKYADLYRYAKGTLRQIAENPRQAAALARAAIDKLELEDGTITIQKAAA